MSVRSKRNLGLPNGVRGRQESIPESFRRMFERVLSSSSTMPSPLELPRPRRERLRIQLDPPAGRTEEVELVEVLRNVDPQVQRPLVVQTVPGHLLCQPEAT